MRHHKAQRKFGRKSNVRRALMRSLMVALIENERITTTLARAKELRPMIEKMVSRAREASLADKRSIESVLANNSKLADKMIKEIAPKYTDRPGGYTRILKLPRRDGDASRQAIIEFV